jgi:hypothetical protein
MWIIREGRRLVFVVVSRIAVRYLIELIFSESWSKGEELCWYLVLVRLRPPKNEI